MKYLEISITVRDDDGQFESVIYQRSVVVPEDPQAEDWRQQSVAKIEQASDEVAELLTGGLSQQANA